MASRGSAAVTVSCVCLLHVIQIQVASRRRSSQIADAEVRLAARPCGQQRVGGDMNGTPRKTRALRW